MIKYVSNTGGGNAVDFETAILDGFATDGGLYVPEEFPTVIVPPHCILPQFAFVPGVLPTTKDPSSVIRTFSVGVAAPVCVNHLKQFPAVPA